MEVVNLDSSSDSADEEDQDLPAVCVSAPAATYSKSRVVHVSRRRSSAECVDVEPKRQKLSVHDEHDELHLGKADECRPITTEKAKLTLKEQRQQIAKEKREAKARAQLEEKERKKEERERKKEEKRLQKELHKAKRKVALATSKDNAPSERVKQLVIVLDKALSESAPLMAVLATELNELGVSYRIGSDCEPGSVQWMRKVSERTVDENARIISNRVEVEERALLVCLEAQGFAGLVHYWKQERQGLPLPAGAQTLKQYVTALEKDNEGFRLTLAIEGLEAFLRGKKTRHNRQFRKAVLSCNQQQLSCDEGGGAFTDVSQLDCSQALVDLQLSHGGCVVRECEEEEDLVQLIVSSTKALADAPCRRENLFSFFSDLGSGASRKELQEADNKVSLIWQHQLTLFNGVSGPIASAIVSVYPSPAHLLMEYKSCDSNSAELLLQDIVVRRGVGAVSSTKRVGPALSRRVHSFLTSTDPTMLCT